MYLSLQPAVICDRPAVYAWPSFPGTTWTTGFGSTRATPLWLDGRGVPVDVRHVSHDAVL